MCDSKGSSYVVLYILQVQCYVHLLCPLNSCVVLQFVRSVTAEVLIMCVGVYPAGSRLSLMRACHSDSGNFDHVVVYTLQVQDIH